ncbi:MAG: hypothetical protein ABT20_03055 [Rubrivivax sp. SCN 70-15]|nr:MAG: hypothetical protein ABT20_03055 [Rubrivivax sp. SCN 70-15]
MTLTRTFSVIAATVVATTAFPVHALDADSHDAHHPAAQAEVRIAQASQPSQGMGMGMGAGMGGQAAMPGYADQMKAMQAMHDKMLAAKTPEERNALMAEQLKLMQDGMAMMGRMGGGMGMGGGAMMGGNRPGAAPTQPGDMAARQGMMEQRMDMMQSMMQMMMDRVTPAPAKK